MVRKVVVTGPESSGKSSMAESLSVYFNAPLVVEYSRVYLNEQSGHYKKEDLVSIAKGQLQLEHLARKQDSNLIICDTSLEVIKIWSEYRYNTCDPFITQMLERSLPDLYLLMKPDIPWEADPLRENPYDRDELYALYLKELKQSGVPFYEIGGFGEDRYSLGESIVKKLFV